jgi:uncharacterized phage protein gp47/JayE
MLSLSQLSTPLTRNTVLEWALEVLKGFGFQTTGWQNGRIQKSMLRTFSTVFSDGTEMVATLTKMGINETASGVGLTLYSKSRYDNERIAAVRTAGPMVLTSTATIPYTIQVGQLIATTTTGRQFRNTTGGTLIAGGTLTLQWEAVLAGAAFNVGNGAVSILVTPLAGVTISNPDSGSGNWFTTIGADEEFDADLQRRNATKFATLSLEWVEAAYENFARNRGARKVLIDASNPRGPGSVDAYLAADFLVYSDPEMLAFQQAFAERTFQTEAVWPPTDSPYPSHVYCKKPSTFTLDPQGVIYFDPSFTAAQVQQNVEQALDDFLTLMPIGGSNYSPGPSNVVMHSDLSDAIEDARGVLAVTLTNPTGNTAVGATSLVVRPSDGWFGSGLSLVPVTN